VSSLFSNASVAGSGLNNALALLIKAWSSLSENANNGAVNATTTVAHTAADTHILFFD
jgi:hypothetical protein